MIGSAIITLGSLGVIVVCTLLHALKHWGR